MSDGSWARMVRDRFRLDVFACAKIGSFVDMVHRNLRKKVSGFRRMAGSPHGGFEKTDKSTGGDLDDDGDGIPDRYKDANGSDKNDPDDAGEDADGDNSTNLAEFIFGTDPNDPACTFEIGVPVVTDVEVSVIYGPVVSGVSYVTEASSDLDTRTAIDTLVADAPPKTVSTLLTGRIHFRVVGSR